MTHKSQNIYNRIKSDIFSSKNIKNDVNCFMFYSSPELVNKYTSRLNSEHSLNRFISGYAFPKDLRDLGKANPMMYNDDLSVIFQWQFNTFSIYVDRINEFLEKRNLLKNFLFKGQFTESLNLLDDIEESLGFSLWSIEYRIAILNEISIELSKEYCSKIINNDEVNPWVKLFTKYFSLRCDKSISPEKYNSIISNFLDESKTASVQACEYFKYRTAKWDLMNPKHYTHMLYLENRFSLIDRYILAIDICKHIFCSKDTSRLVLLNTEIFKIIKYINDATLRNLYFFINDLYQIETDGISFVIDEAIYYYTKGDYEKCIELCEIVIQDNFYIEVIELYVKANMHIGKKIDCKNEKNYFNIILNCIWKIYSDYSGEYFENISVLLKICLVYQNENWTSFLLSFLEKILDSKEDDYYYIKSSIDCEFINPKSLLAITSESIKLKFKEVFSSFYKSTNALSIFSAIENNDISLLKTNEIEEKRIVKYESRILKKQGDFTSAIKKIRSIYSLDNQATRSELASDLIECYQKSGNLYECEILILENYFINNDFIYRIDLKEIICKIELSPYEIMEYIYTPIICNIYSRMISDDKKNLEFIAYEEFLELHHATRPSELEPEINNFETKYFQYFLEYVCIPSIMDNSIAFEKYEDVIKERIAVLQLLTRFNPEKSEIYSNEIRTLTQNLMIKNLRSKVENSKIYVDLPGVKETLEKNLFEMYESYKDNILYDFSYELKSILQMIEKNSETNTKVYFIQPKSDQILSEMISKVRDVFVSNNKYGLDGYLSVRIRHGTLEGQLRSCFVSKKLITTKDIMNQYNDNDFWKERVSDNTKVNDIMKLLSEFSFSIDKIISVFKQEWIQIRTENKNDYGLFDFRIDDIFIYSVKSKINKDTAFNDFLDIVIKELWTISEVCLQDIRERALTLVQQNFEDALDKLLYESENYQNVFDFGLLKRNITDVKTDIIYEITKIKEWFRLSNTIEFDDYNISIAFDISLEIIKNIYPDYEIDKNSFTIINDFKLKGNTLISIVDIIIILLDNIVKHSKTGRNFTISGYIERVDNKVIIYCENVLEKSVVINKEGIDFSRQQIQEWENLGLVQKEGGTGFHKIKKILSIDMKCKNKLEFDYLEDYKFFVKIDADLEGILL